MTAIAAIEQPDPLQRARSGDHDAFGELVAAHQAMVFSIAFHFFNDRDRAADIAQDIFLQLYRHLDGIGSTMHLVHWLRQVTTRRCIDEARRARLRAVPLDDVTELAAADRAHDPLLGRTLRKLVTALPEMQRLVLTLRYQEELGPNEISRIVGLRVNTVKSQLHRALQALRRKLEESHG
ncbi:MAG TPA: sigma-70 family RNA polymerase sigma factor [Thermoanaerobaculia bacterium]|nr:sigma-70 family RNA polymerase sigma factor [Thermoanaerobaculia bacterium]